MKYVLILAMLICVGCAEKPDYIEINEPLSNFTCVCGQNIYLAGYYLPWDEHIACAGCKTVWKITSLSLIHV